LYNYSRHKITCYIDPISDNEEEKNDSPLVNAELVTLSERALGKRRRSCVSETKQEVDQC
jgi:hypothetical protein